MTPTRSKCFEAESDTSLFDDVLDFFGELPTSVRWAIYLAGGVSITAAILFGLNALS